MTVFTAKFIHTQLCKLLLFFLHVQQVQLRGEEATVSVILAWVTVAQFGMVRPGGPFCPSTPSFPVVQRFLNPFQSRGQLSGQLGQSGSVLRCQWQEALKERDQLPWQILETEKEKRHSQKNAK